MTMRRRDPPIREDGRCRCGKRRPPVAVTHKDPWCSTNCARTWHGVELVLDEQPSAKAARKRWEKEAAAA